MSEQLREAIHRYFREFGHEVADAIYGEVVKPGGMRRLLRRLDLYGPEDSGAQYENLVYYLRESSGLNNFMQMVGLKPLDFQIGMDHDTADASQFEKAAEARVERLKRKITDSDPGKQTPSERDRRAVDPEPPPQLSPVPEEQKAEPPKPAATTKTSGKPSPYDYVDDRGFPKGELRPAPAPKPGSFGKDTPSYDSSKPNDPTGTWPEVERRSGRERRSGKERRKDVDIVFKNQRYGGDRRSKVERRQNWPKGGHKQ